MALSRSFEKAQTFAVCQWCEESSDIKWKCINCDLFLCQLCNSRIHSKNETLRDHKVINLKECGTEVACETIRKVDLQKLLCTSHDTQKCFVYCTDCEEPICAQCLIQSHQNHKLIHLEDVYKTKVDEIKDMKSEIEAEFSYFQQEEGKLKQTLSDGDKLFRETKNIILQREKEIKEAATKYSQELVKDLESLWRPSEAEIKKELSEVTKTKDELQDKKQNLDHALQSHQVADIFTASHNLNKTLPRKSVKQIKPEQTKFIPTHTAMLSKGDLFGTLFRVSELELLKTYQTGLMTVSNILHCRDDIAYISRFTSETMQKVQFDADKLKILHEVKIAVYDMSMMPNGDVLISARQSDLMLYSNDKITIFKTFSQFTTLGVHVIESTDILVGLSQSGNFTTKKGKVSVLNQCGDLQHTYEFDTVNRKLFTCPVRICTFNDKICVVDLLDDSRNLEGSVVCFNKGGQLQWVYNGCDRVNSGPSKFKPWDVVMNQSLVVISDPDNHAIHVLNHQGEIIVCNAGKDLGIKHPYSLNIDKDRMLWIGGFTDHDKAKIYCLKIKE